MSFSELFDSGFTARNKDHFAAIVRVAMTDGVVSNAEKEFLDRLAHNLQIDEHDYKTILKDYNSHPINPPTLYINRLERLYDLARMVYVDRIAGENQEHLLVKIGIGLGFTPANVRYIVDKALVLVSMKVDLDTFIEEMRLMNR